MSIEQELARNTAALEKHAALLEQLLAKTGNVAAGTTSTSAADKPASEDKPKTTTKKADKPAEDKAEKTEAAAPTVTVETLDAKFRPWLGEFAKDHPETAARKAKFKELLGQLGETKMSEITDASKLQKLHKWFETKAKSWDEGFGIGRFAKSPDEVDADEEGGDDDL